MSSNKTKQSSSEIQLNPGKWDRMPDDIIDLIIRCVKKRPSLYNCYMEDYLRQPVREQQWAEIAEYIYRVKRKIIAVPILKTRWRHLRDTFIKNYKKIQAGMSLKLVGNRTQVFQSMKFLVPYIRSNTKKNKTPNYKVIEINDDDMQELESQKIRYSPETLEDYEAEEILGDGDSYSTESLDELETSTVGTANKNKNTETTLNSAPPSLCLSVDESEEEEDKEEDKINQQGVHFITFPDIINENKTTNDQISNNKKKLKRSAYSLPEEAWSIKQPNLPQIEESWSIVSANVNSKTQATAPHVISSQGLQVFNENELFFLSMAKICNTLPIDKQIEIRKKTHDLISNIQLSCITSGSAQICNRQIAVGDVSSCNEQSKVNPDGYITSAQIKQDPSGNINEAAASES